MTWIYSDNHLQTCLKDINSNWIYELSTVCLCEPALLVILLRIGERNRLFSQLHFNSTLHAQKFANQRNDVGRWATKQRLFCLKYLFRRTFWLQNSQDFSAVLSTRLWAASIHLWDFKLQKQWLTQSNMKTEKSNCRGIGNLPLLCRDHLINFLPFDWGLTRKFSGDWSSIRVIQNMKWGNKVVTYEKSCILFS